VKRSARSRREIKWLGTLRALADFSSGRLSSAPGGPIACAPFRQGSTFGRFGASARAAADADLSFAKAGMIVVRSTCRGGSRIKF